jgi:Domain of unknown function (DUF4350)
MPLKIGKSDRRFLLWAGAFLLPLIAAVALLSDEDEESNVPSTYSAQTQGAKAAYLLLEEQGYKVERWTHPPTQLPADAAGTVYVLAGPWGTPTREEKNALQNYLTRGGKVLATSYGASFFLPQASVEFETAPAPEWKEYPPQLLTGLTRGGPITMSPAAYWKTTATNVFVHYADNKRPIVVSYNVGNGEVIWWARATPLTNLGITAKGNLALLLNSLGGKDVRVLWDEYYHGERDTLDAYFHEPPLKYGFVQCLLLAMALILTYSRRNSPIYPPDSPPRLSPLEFVHTLGGLYRRAHATRSALEIPYNRFRMLAARQLGLKPDVEAALLALALRKRTGSKDKGLEELLNEIETTLRYGDPKEEQVLKLLQELNRHMQDLKLIGKPE